jgi:F-type H+-transporting ATPase subunit b
LKRNKGRMLLLIFLVSFFAGVLLLDGSFAFAQEGTPSWRKVWNNIMLFFNFGILVFVFLKYARKPLMNLIKNMRLKIEETLNTTNHQVREAQAVLDAETAKLQAIEEHLEAIQKRILQIAQAEKDSIIEHGRASAERMIENAGDYANYRLGRARKALTDELVEIAVAMAKERLSRGISAQDDNRLIENFLHGLEASKKHYTMALS